MPKFLEPVIAFISKKQFYGPIIAIASAIILYYILIAILNKFMKFGQTELEIKKRKTIIQLCQNILRYLLVIIVILIILQIFGVNTGTLIAGLGVIGLVVGLALQDILKDFISGINIIMDNYYVVGDTIEYKGFKGEVIALGLRSTKIKKYSGEVQTFANRNVDLVVNYSQKNSNQLFEITTDYDIDTDKVEKILAKIITKIENVENVVKKESSYLGISEITDTKIKHLLTIKCKRMTQYQVKREVIKIIKDEFDKQKIKIAIA